MLPLSSMAAESCTMASVERDISEGVRITNFDLVSIPFPLSRRLARMQRGPYYRAGCDYGWIGSVTGPDGFTFFLSSPVPFHGWHRAS